MVLKSTSSPLLERLFSEEEARIPATFEEYLEVSDESDFKMEYSNGHIVLLEFPTATHEQICATIAWTFGDLFSDEDPFSGYGGNLLFYLQATGNGYKPDVSILNAPPEFICHKSGEKTFKSVLNPFAVFEVFSDSTMDYDMTEKLPAYKLCPSLRYIIYIHQHKPFVTIFHRQNDDPEGWLSKDCLGLESSFQFEEKTVEMKKLYRKVIFMGGGKKEKPEQKD